MAAENALDMAIEAAAWAGDAAKDCRDAGRETHEVVQDARAERRQLEQLVTHAKAALDVAIRAALGRVQGEAMAVIDGRMSTITESTKALIDKWRHHADGLQQQYGEQLIRMQDQILGAARDAIRASEDRGRAHFERFTDELRAALDSDERERKAYINGLRDDHLQLRARVERLEGGRR